MVTRCIIRINNVNWENRSENRHSSCAYFRFKDFSHGQSPHGRWIQMPKARGKKEKSFGYAGAISKTVPLAEFGLGTSGWLFVSKARIKVFLSNQSHPSSVKCTVNSPGVEPFMAASRCFCCRIILVCSLQSSSACLSLKKIMSFSL